MIETHLVYGVTRRDTVSADIEPEIEKIKRGENVEYTHSKKFVFSAVSPEDKYTEELIRCVALALSGTNPINGEIVSMLAHISPAMICERYAQEFGYALDEKLAEFKQATLPSTRIAGLAGGLWGSLKRDGFINWAFRGTLEQYQMQMGINAAVNRSLGLEVNRLYPPKKHEEQSGFYLATQRNKVILIEH
jgi:hypothetical protein